MIMMIVSVPSVELARSIAHKLLTNSVAGCVQILKSVESIYLWKEKQETANESILFIKLPKKNRRNAEKIIREIHIYEIPEILSFNIDANQDYKRWLYSVTQ